jgi:hypothetical protein
VNAEVSQLAVIKTRLPYVDQRALSQAWFTALHLAADVATQHTAAPEPAAVAAPEAVRTMASAAPTATATSQASASLAQRSARRASSLAPAAADVRSRTNTMCVRRGPGAAAPQMQPVFTATLLHARVQLALRRDGNRMQVIAVCSERHADAVRKALALAAIALQMNGVATVASLRIGVSR